MTEPKPGPDFSRQLLQQDQVVQSSRYKEHRMALEMQLQRAERTEKRVYWIVVFAAIIAGAAFLGMASRGFRGADPYDTNGSILMMTLGVIYWLSSTTFLVGLASYYSRFRVVTKEIKERIVIESLRELREEVSELRKRFEAGNDRPQA